MLSRISFNFEEWTIAPHRHPAIQWIKGSVKQKTKERKLTALKTLVNFMDDTKGPWNFNWVALTYKHVLEIAYRLGPAYARTVLGLLYYAYREGLYPIYQETREKCSHLPTLNDLYKERKYGRSRIKAQTARLLPPDFVWDVLEDIVSDKFDEIPPKKVEAAIILYLIYFLHFTDGRIQNLNIGDIILAPHNSGEYAYVVTGNAKRQKKAYPIDKRMRFAFRKHKARRKKQSKKGNVPLFADKAGSPRRRASSTLKVLRKDYAITKGDILFSSKHYKKLKEKYD